MSYTKSLARKDFDSHIAHILVTCRTSGAKKHSLKKETIELLYQAAIFKCSALLEEYIRSVITDWLFLIKKNGHKCNQLPENLKFFIHSQSQTDHFRNYFFYRDEARLIKAAKGNTTLKVIEDTQDAGPFLHPASIANNRKYPSVKNIKSVFARIGVDGIFDILNRKRKKDFVSLVDSFLSIREAIAHSNPPPLTYPDVKMHLSYIREFVSAVDSTLYSHVIKHSGKVCWRVI